MNTESYLLNKMAIEIDKEMRRVTFEEQCYYENTYLNEHNHTCPLCKKPIRKNFRNILTDVGIIGMIKIEEQQMNISYILCKKCSKTLMRSSDEQKKEFEESIASHVLSTIS